MITHFYSSYTPKDPSTRERQRVAQLTWSTQFWRDLPIKDSSMRRMWSEEGKHYPYATDLFDFAVIGTEPEDILVYTNSDICVRSDCALRVAGAMQDTDAFFSMRRDFNHDFSEPIPDASITKGDAYVGSDFYAFRSYWWRTHRNAFPDMIIACELWDAVLRQLIMETNQGKQFNVPNLTYHRRHASQWENPENRYRLKGQIHNLSVGGRWLKTHGVNPEVHGVPNSMLK